MGRNGKRPTGSSSAGSKGKAGGKNSNRGQGRKGFQSGRYEQSSGPHYSRKGSVQGGQKGNPKGSSYGQGSQGSVRNGAHEEGAGHYSGVFGRKTEERQGRMSSERPEEGQSRMSGGRSEEGQGRMSGGRPEERQGRMSGGMPDERRGGMPGGRHRHGGGHRVPLILGIAIVIVAVVLLVLFFAADLFAGLWNTDAGDATGESGTTTEEQETEEEIATEGLANVTDQAQITQYFTYGTSLCLDGTVELVGDLESLSDLDLVLRVTDDETLADTYAYDTVYTISEETITFSSYNYINEGIDLDAIGEGNYYLLLRAEYSDGTNEYYTFEDNSQEDEEVCYYTVTKDASNNCVEIGFTTVDQWSCLQMDVAQSELPDDVYDIVIDPGHGGTDVGATNGSYYESDLMLEYGLALAEALEEAGYKVALTRDGTEDADADMAYDMYDSDGRVNIACATSAKYCLSLHLNSNEQFVTGGVQCYISCRASDIFASSLVENIVNTVGTTYSSMETYYVSEGVYARPYTESEIDEANLEAQQSGYDPYDLTTDTDYYFMIRELGGIATNAYVDGRNTDYGANQYCDSIQGIESYVLELGFLSVESDLMSILYNQDAYIQAIVESFTQLQEEEDEETTTDKEGSADEDLATNEETNLTADEDVTTGEDLGADGDVATEEELAPGEEGVGQGQEIGTVY